MPEVGAERCSGEFGAARMKFGRLVARLIRRISLGDGTAYAIEVAAGSRSSIPSLVCAVVDAGGFRNSGIRTTESIRSNRRWSIEVQKRYARVEIGEIIPVRTCADPFREIAGRSSQTARPI